MALRRLLSSQSARLLSSGAHPVCDTSVAAYASRTISGDASEYCRQRQVIPLGNRIPFLAQEVWLAPTAVVVGDVDLYDKVSIMFGCVLRGDLNNIRIERDTVIHDNTVIHAARTSPTGLSAATRIGRAVTVGPGCALRSCRIGDHAVVGEGSILMEGSVVEPLAALQPGSVVPPGRLVPSLQLWGGSPAQFIRDLTKDELADMDEVAVGHQPVAATYAADELPVGTAWRPLARSVS